MDFAKAKEAANDQKAIERHPQEEHRDVVEKWTLEYDHSFRVTRRGCFV